MRITHISDTHNHHSKLQEDLPGGDLLIHSGDFTSIGRKSEVERFIKWFNKIDNYTNKVFIAGNHDLSFESEALQRRKADWFDGRKEYEEPAEEGKPYWLSQILDREFEGLVNNVFYLENESITIAGVKIWGSPYSARFGRDWAFNIDRGSASRELWGTIPTDTNIIVTHGPLFGVGDITDNNMNVGCDDLRETIMNLEPDFHLCGHIHEGYGYTQFGKTHCINGSNLSLEYKYKNKPISFDYNFQTKDIQFLM
jgi:Icc-related predicted phosphoesterase